MFWFVVAWIASFALVYFLMPKPQTAPPPALGTFKAPTNDVGREVPVLFGTRDILGPNILWYGDIKTEEHRIDASSGKK